MRNRNALRAGVAIAGLVALGACVDAPPTQPQLEAELFASPLNPQLHGNTSDAMLVQIAKEIPSFGGFYFDEAGTLNMYVKGPQVLAAGEQDRLGEMLANLNVDVGKHGPNLVQGKYNFVELDQMHSRVGSTLNINGVVYTDIDDASNGIAIGVSSAQARAQVEAALASMNLPADAVTIRDAEPVYPMATLRDHVRPVAGGLQINFPGFLCTLGFNVRSPQAPNVHGFVTNSHCTNVQGSMTSTPYWQPTSVVANSFIGTEAHDLPFFTGGVCPAGRVCRWSDAAGVRYAPGVSNAFARIYRTEGIGSLTIDAANPQFTITAERAFPNVGDVMHKVGRTTGWTSGTVTNTCVNTNVGGGTNITMLCQDWATGPANTVGSGDSGSPVFDNISGNNVRLVGLLWGGAGSTVFVFSSMNEIRFENAGPGGASYITHGTAP